MPLKSRRNQKTISKNIEELEKKYPHKQAIAITTGRFMMTYTEFTLTDNAITVPLETPSRFPEGTDLAIYTSGEAGAFASCTARGWLEAI